MKNISNLLLLSVTLILPNLSFATGPDCYPDVSYTPPPTIEEPVSTSRLQDFPISKSTKIQLITNFVSYSNSKVKITTNHSFNEDKLEFMNSTIAVEDASKLILELKKLSTRHDKIRTKIRFTTKKYAEADPYACESYTGRVLYRCSLDLVVPGLEHLGTFKGPGLSRRESVYDCEQYFNYITDLVFP